MSANEPPHAARSPLKQRALDRWENEGGEISSVPTARRGETSAGTGSRKKLIIFDLDGTLAESKAALDAEMAALRQEMWSSQRLVPGTARPATTLTRVDATVDLHMEG